MTLNNLKMNTKAIVQNVSCSESLKRRFYDLGLLSGTPITAIFTSPLGDPRAYEFRGNIIAIRNDDAKNVTLKNIIF